MMLLVYLILVLGVTLFVIGTHKIRRGLYPAVGAPKSRVDYAKIERLERELLPHLHPEPIILPAPPQRSMHVPLTPWEVTLGELYEKFMAEEED